MTSGLRGDLGRRKTLSREGRGGKEEMLGGEKNKNRSPNGQALRNKPPSSDSI